MTFYERQLILFDYVVKAEYYFIKFYGKTICCPFSFEDSLSYIII